MALNWVKLHLKTLLIWVLVLIDSRWCETWNTFFSLIHSFIIISAFMELLCCLCVNMHWSVFSCVSPPPTSGYESICIYVWILRKRDRERERQSDTGREKRHLWISPPGTEASRLVLYQVLWALMLLLLPPLTPTATPSDTSGDRHSQITWIAIVSRSSKRNHLKKNLWCSLCFISSALTQKAIMMSELAEARPVSPRGHFCQLLFGSV